MNRNIRTQATALCLAACVTVSLLASIQQLASSPAPQGLLARTAPDAAPVQVVVVTAKRASAV